MGVDLEVQMKAIPMTNLVVESLMRGIEEGVAKGSTYKFLDDV